MRTRRRRGARCCSRRPEGLVFRTELDAELDAWAQTAYKLCTLSFSQIEGMSIYNGWNAHRERPGHDPAPDRIRRCADRSGDEHGFPGANYRLPGVCRRAKRLRSRRRFLLWEWARLRDSDGDEFVWGIRQGNVGNAGQGKG